ncbi:major capsid protein, partial [Rhizobium leguminosarum]|uniref:major capsid protein n=1 Tax=Rhizobium ruizarguesonis TaxID=2081791 RepID=UPI0013BA8846
PKTVDVILYPAGTWWGAVEPVVNLGIIRDSALIRQNKQIQMFTEDGVAVGKRGPESRQVTIPVAVNGTVGPRYTPAVPRA